MSEIRQVGTDNWRAYALFRVAMTRKAGQERKSILARALDQDASFRAARLNLAIELWSDARRLTADSKEAEQLRERAVGQLERVLTEAKTKNDWHEDKSYYKALLALAILKNELDLPEQAYEKSKELLHEIEGNLRKAGEAKKTQAIKRYLEQAKPQALLVMRTMEFLKEPSKGTGGIDEIAEKYEKTSSVWTLHNLASAYAIVGRKLQDKEKKKESAQKALSYIETCLALNPDRVKNFRMDTTLKWLGEYDLTKERFEELIQGAAAAEPPEPAPGPLSDVRLIGAKYAKALADEGIKDFEDLLQQAADPKMRQELASALGVTAALVERWVRLVDLLRIIGLRAPELNLLNEAAIYTVPSLAAANPVEITALLRDLAETLDAQAPDVAAVTGWIGQAKKLEPRIA